MVGGVHQKVPRRLEHLGDVSTNEKYDTRKSCPGGIVYRVIHKGLAIGSDRFQLLESAVTGTHAGGKYE